MSMDFLSRGVLGAGRPKLPQVIMVKPYVSDAADIPKENFRQFSVKKPKSKKVVDDTIPLKAQSMEHLPNAVNSSQLDVSDIVRERSRGRSLDSHKTEVGDIARMFNREHFLDSHEMTPSFAKSRPNRIQHKSSLTSLINEDGLNNVESDHISNSEFTASDNQDDQIEPPVRRKLNW